MNIDYDDIQRLDIKDELRRRGTLTEEQVKDKSVEIDDELYERVNDYVEDCIREELQYKVSDLMYQFIKEYFEYNSVKPITSIVLDEED